MSRNPLVDAADPSEELETNAPEVEETEVEAEAGQQEEPEKPSFALPKKLEGKTLEDIASMYVNLEKELGRQANEIGVYRDLVATLGDSKRKKDLAEADTEDSTVEVTSDDLFENPNEAITKVIKGALEKELKPLKQTQAQAAKQRQIEQLVSDYPDLEQIGADPAFQAFVERSPYRLQDAQRWLETQDVDAARRLLTDWADVVQQKPEAKAPASEVATEKPPRGNVKAAKKAATESGGNASVGKKVLTKSDVMKMIQTDPDRYYSDSFQQELALAIKEGRFRA